MPKEKTCRNYESDNGVTFLRKMLISRHPAQTQPLPGAVCDFKKWLTMGKAKGKKLEKISLGAA